MRNRRLAVGIVVVLVAAIALWWWNRGQQSDTPATPAVTQRAGSGSQATRSASRSAAPASVEVTVRDGRGVLAGATVRIAPEDGDVMLLKTDANGIALAKVAPGTYEISASAPDHEPAALPDEELASGEAAKLAVTLVAGGRTLSGTVTDVSGGPVGGVRIDAAKLGGARPSSAIATTTTGGDGKYKLTVAEGQLLVAARSPDYAAQSRYVEVGPDGATADFALVPGGVIEGVVLDDKTKQPVAGAVIDARRDSPAMMLAETGGHHVTAGEDGRFRIAGLRPGVYDLDAHHESRRSKAPTVVGLGVAEQVSDVQILVGAGAVVRGKVIDETNAPVAGASILSLGGERSPDGASDASGAFALEGMAAGNYMLLARSETHVSAGMTRIELADRDLDGVVVRVKRGKKLKGHVEPRQVAEVELERDDTEVARPMLMAPVSTKADGEFELGPVLPGKATLSARCASGDQGSMELTIAPDTGEIILKVSPGAAIAGRVVDGTGKPVAGATVMAAAQGPSERTMIVNGRVTSGIQALTNGSGAYELKGLAAGSYRLSVLDRGKPLRMRKAIPPVKVAATEKKTGIELAVDRPNGVIKGVVVGPDGKPLADAWVSVHQDLDSLLAGAMAGRGKPDDDQERGESRFVTVQSSEDDSGGAGASPPALTDEQGRFELTGLSHATYDVIAEAQAGKLRGRADAVTPDATLTIQALGVTSLAGTVRSATGPVGLFTVELEGPTRAQRSFTDGKFSLGRVDPGTYTVRVTSSEGNAETKVVVAPNTPATVDIVLVANAVVVGTVVDPSGKPLADVPVTVIDDTGGQEIRVSISGPPLTSGPDGKFRLEHKAGLGTLVVLVPPRPTFKKGLVLEAGKTLDVGAVRVEQQPPPPAK